jgi:hypothetical protein
MPDRLSEIFGITQHDWDRTTAFDAFVGAAAMPLHISTSHVRSFNGFRVLVRTILNRFKELVELNRLYRLFYNDNGTPRREKAAQLALFGVADAYCSANDVDLSPEADSDTGPVDFKFSTGYSARILAEVKLSTNSKLLDGFNRQLAAYQAAEKTYCAFYVVIRIDDSTSRINALTMRHNDAAKLMMDCPELIIIDARPTKSASKR